MNHLYFTKSERQALLGLVAVLCITQMVLLFVKWKEHQSGKQNHLIHVEIHDHIVSKPIIDTAQKQRFKVPLITASQAKKPMSIRLESLNEAMLQSHGLSKMLINNWVNYFNKGMSFETKQDIMQVYGMTENIYQEIEPYLVFAPKKELFVYNEPASQADQHTYFRKPEKLKVDINTAKESELQQLYGIGKVLSSRIIKYRDLIGGYLSKEQLYNVYGLRSTLVDSLSDQMIVDGSAVEKLNVFEASEQALSELYFVSPYLAKKIKQLINSRYVNIYNSEDLIKHLDYDHEKLKQAIPYLDFSRNEEESTD